MALQPGLASSAIVAAWGSSTTNGGDLLSMHVIGMRPSMSSQLQHAHSASCLSDLSSFCRFYLDCVCRNSLLLSQFVAFKNHRAQHSDAISKPCASKSDLLDLLDAQDPFAHFWRPTSHQSHCGCLPWHMRLKSPSALLWPIKSPSCRQKCSRDALLGVSKKRSKVSNQELFEATVFSRSDEVIMREHLAQAFVVAFSLR
jgi:hypothetical protein